jgi:hypothetical protein
VGPVGPGVPDEQNAQPSGTAPGTIDEAGSRIARTPTNLGEHYYGVDIADNGALMIAERMNGKRTVAARYPAGEMGV